MMPRAYTCSKCGTERSFNEFHKRPDRPVRGFKSWCRPCGAEYMKEYRAKKKVSDIEAYRRREADYNLRRYDGMSLDEYGRLLSEQDGGCAICGAKAVGHKGRNRFHVDHDHSTGMVRGLLCHGCNAGIGNLGDDAERIAKAAAYLRRKKAN